MEISVLGKRCSIDSSRIITFQSQASSAGSTSVRNVNEKNLEWKENGYFQRNRDLGQVFYVSSDVNLRSIVLRTGPSDKAVLQGSQGAEVFIQFFEVKGEPKINDNGTSMGSKSRHGFSDVHRCDDFIENITYIPLSTIYRGKFPFIDATYPPEDVSDNNLGRLVYMRWHLNEPIYLTANKRYAFLVGFCEANRGYGFTLANINMAGIDDQPHLNDSYPNGWGIRREGDGSLPPIMISKTSRPDDRDILKQLVNQALFPPGNQRFMLTPTTDGYPDVDTYRDLEFVLEQ